LRLGQGDGGNLMQSWLAFGARPHLDDDQRTSEHDGGASG